MITIVDYGMGNLGSIQNMLKYIGINSEVTSDIDKLSKARRILLPGVGAFDTAMQSLASKGLQEVLNQKAKVEKVPILGICLGMQLLTRGSEEGKCAGFGWIPAKTVKFNAFGGIKIPHMGWNIVKPTYRHTLLNGFPADVRFYFVHSYHVRADEEKYVLMKTVHGYEFDSMITNGDNIFGAQFHPEKSHRYGMRLLENFAKL